MQEFGIKIFNTKTGHSYIQGDISTDKAEACFIANDLNIKAQEINSGLSYSVVTITETIQEKKYQCDMTDEELKEYQKTLMEINDDLRTIIDFDEWAAREYGETRVDYYSTAIQLYAAGYRKVVETKE